MTWLIVFLAVSLGSIAAAWWWMERPPCISRRVIVNLRFDQETGYSGVLWRSHGAWIVLKDVRAMRSDGKVTPVDGDAVFHRDSVLFMQMPPGGV